MKAIEVKVMPLDKAVRIPSYGSIGASGLDLHALLLLEKEIIIQPFERQLIPTGIAIALPTGFEAQIRPRSGLALNHGVTVLNSPATIDSDYRGEIKVLLANFGKEAFSVEPNMRIAQLVIAPVSKVDLTLSDSLTTTERGRLGFGSTGLY